MDLENIMKEITTKGYVTIQQAIDFTKSRNIKMQNKYDEYGDIVVNDSIQVFKLAKTVLKMPKSGDADDYFNYAVLFGRDDEYTMACDILLQGLKKYPRNIDLLSIFLKYAVDSSKHYDMSNGWLQKIKHFFKIGSSKNSDMCNNIYKKLLEIPKTRWNWRAFDSSIYYLLDSLDRYEIDENIIKNEAIGLAKEFQESCPENELGFFHEAKIYEKYNDQESANVVLLKAFNNSNLVAPRSSMRLAEISFDNKKYNDVLLYIHRFLADQLGKRYNPSPYAFILSFLSRTSQFLNENANSTSQDEEKIKEIYKDFSKAQEMNNKMEDTDDTSSSLLKIAEKYITLIEIMSGVSYDGDDM